MPMKTEQGGKPYVIPPKGLKDKTYDLLSRGWNSAKSVVGKAVGAVLPYGEQIIDAAGNILGGHMQNVANEQLADKQMAFQERMSNTQVQRYKADLLAAGFNPMYAAFPGGSAPQGASARMENELAPAINSAQRMRAVKADIQRVIAETDLTRELVKAARSENVDKALQAEISDSKFGRLMAYINRAAAPVNSAVSAGRLLK